MKRLLLALLALAYARPALAHHQGDPSSSSYSSNVLSAHLLEPGQTYLNWSLQAALYSLTSAEDLKARTLAQGPEGKIQVPDAQIMQNLELGLGAYEWLQVSISLGWQRVENLREGHVHGDGSYGFHNFANPSGMCNAVLATKWSLARGEDWWLSASVGAALPTGEDNALSDGVSVDAYADTATGKLKSSPKFSYLSPAFQAGNGTTRGMLGLAYTQEWGLWEGSASLSADLPAWYRGYKPGASGSLGFSWGRLFGEAGHERGLASLQLAVTQAEPSFTDGKSGDDGGLSLAAGASLRLPLGRRAAWSATATLPVLQPEAHGAAQAYLGLGSSLNISF